MAGWVLLGLRILEACGKERVRKPADDGKMIHVNSERFFRVFVFEIQVT